MRLRAVREGILRLEGGYSIRGDEEIPAPVHIQPVRICDPEGRRWRPRYHATAGYLHQGATQRCRWVATPLTSPADPEGVVLVAEFRSDVREVYHAVMASSRHGPALWPAYVLMLAVVGWTTIAPLWRRWEVGDLANASIAVTLLGLFPLILILAIRPLASFWAAHRYVKTSRLATAVQRITVAETGIQIAGPFRLASSSGRCSSRWLKRSASSSSFSPKHSPSFFPRGCSRERPWIPFARLCDAAYLMIAWLFLEVTSNLAMHLPKRACHRWTRMLGVGPLCR